MTCDSVTKSFQKLVVQQPERGPNQRNLSIKTGRTLHLREQRLDMESRKERCGPPYHVDMRER